MNRPRLNRVAACLVSAVALAALAVANGDKFIYDDSDLRDPMMPYVKPDIKPVEEPKGPKGPVPPTDEAGDIRKIQDVIAMCTIDGVTVTETKRYVCINDRIIVPGDKAIPLYDVRIDDITEKEVVFELNSAKVRYIVTPLVTNTMMMSSDVPTKDEEKKTL